MLLPGGETIKNIKEQSRAHVELQRNPPPNTDPNVRIFSIRGTPQQLEKARQLIDERIGVGGPPLCLAPGIHERTCWWCGELGCGGCCWWPAGCHQGLNVKNPSNGLNGVHRRLALPFDLACWPPQTQVWSLPHASSLLLCSAAGPGDGGQQQLRHEPLQPGADHPSTAVRTTSSSASYWKSARK